MKNGLTNLSDTKSQRLNSHASPKEAMALTNHLCSRPESHVHCLDYLLELVKMKRQLSPHWTPVKICVHETAMAHSLLWCASLKFSGVSPSLTPEHVLKKKHSGLKSQTMQFKVLMNSLISGKVLFPWHDVSLSSQREIIASEVKADSAVELDMTKTEEPSSVMSW